MVGLMKPYSNSERTHKRTLHENDKIFSPLDFYRALVDWNSTVGFEKQSFLGYAANFYGSPDYFANQYPHLVNELICNLYPVAVAQKVARNESDNQEHKTMAQQMTPEVLREKLYRCASIVEKLYTYYDLVDPATRKSQDLVPLFEQHGGALKHFLSESNKKTAIAIADTFEQSWRGLVNPTAGMTVASTALTR